MPLTLRSRLDVEKLLFCGLCSQLPGKRNLRGALSVVGTPHLRPLAKEKASFTSPPQVELAQEGGLIFPLSAFD